jgi:hypothetical protein
MTSDALAGWAYENPEDVYDALDTYQTMRAAIAREDPNEFMEFVLRDDRDNSPIVQAPIHEEFQRICTEDDRAIIWSHVESGKTSQISIGRALWELGRDPNLKIGIVSGTAKQSYKPLRSIKKYIETSRELRMVFPKLVPGKTWSETNIIIDRDTRSKDPSIAVYGTGSRSVLGSRIDLLILDDIITLDNAYNESKRQDVIDWVQSELMGRLTDGARVWFVGNAYHPDDLLHFLAKNPIYRSYRFPVLRPDGESIWPDHWSQDRIAFKRQELGPHEFARQMLCLPRDEGAAKFRREWIDACMKRGDQKTPTFALEYVPQGYRVITGVDLGVGKKNSDLTCLFTICIHPNEDREVLEIQSGRWSGPEIVTRLEDVHNRFQSIIYVENNAAQDFIIQFARSKSAIPVKAFTTGKNKHNVEFGVESLAGELANTKWIIPSYGGRANPEVEAWIAEMLYYDPRGHTGDRLMASWIAREGSRIKKKQARYMSTANLGVR